MVSTCLQIGAMFYYKRYIVKHPKKNCKRKRKPKKYEEVDRDLKISHQLNEWSSSDFRKRYRLEQAEFLSLAGKIQSHLDSAEASLTPKVRRLRKRGRTPKNGKLSVYVVMAITLRYLAGGAPIDICDISSFGVITIKSL